MGLKCKARANQTPVSLVKRRFGTLGVCIVLKLHFGRIFFDIEWKDISMIIVDSVTCMFTRNSFHKGLILFICSKFVATSSHVILYILLFYSTLTILRI